MSIIDGGEPKGRFGGLWEILLGFEAGKIILN